MIHVRTDEESAILRSCGRINAEIHSQIRKQLQVGVTTQDLDDTAGEILAKHNATSSIQGIDGFPKRICTSVNHEIGHGVPGKYVIQSGDIVKVDVSVEYQGYHTDCALSHIVGEVTPEANRLVSTTQQSLHAGIRAAQCGVRCSDISAAIEREIRAAGYTTVRKAFGHGIGQSLHEAPSIANFGPGNHGPRLRRGMVLAIEPVVSAHSRLAYTLPDGWTDVTIDDALSAHFEHTVLITDGEPEVITLGAEPPEAKRSSNLHSKSMQPAVMQRPLASRDKAKVLALAATEMDPILMEAWGRRVNPHEIFSPDVTTIVLEAQTGEIVGFFTYSQVDNALHLNTLVVDSKHQGKGIGKLAMEQFESIAQTKRLSKMTLCVQTNNNRAIGFYQKLGFQIAGPAYANTLLMVKLHVPLR